MKYPALGLALALACACAPRAVDRARVADAGNAGPGRDSGREAADRPDLPIPADPAPGPGPTPPPPAPPPPPADAAVDLPDPVDTPPPRPDFSSAVAASCADATPWQSGKQYQAGDSVVHGEPTRKFECRPWPNTPWCWLPDYEPGKHLFYDDAWIDRGACP